MKDEALEKWLEWPGFEPLDRHFARLIVEKEGNESTALGQGAALVSWARAQGHLCLKLDALPTELTLGDEDPDAATLPLPCANELWDSLERARHMVGPPGAGTPLIRGPGRSLYLSRYWDYEQRVAHGLRRLARTPPPTHDAAKLADALRASFPAGKDGNQVNWQEVAALAVLRKPFCLITGGPGTGKTTTLTRVLQVVFELEGFRRVALAAPTGKAATRMQESLHGAGFDESLLIRAPGTIHRLLGPIPSSPRFRHDAENPLPLDLLVIDEASMMDVALFAKVLHALPPGARLVLLGDKDQLASVDAGDVLGDICAAVPPNRFSQPFVEAYRGVRPGIDVPIATEVGALTDCVVQLMERHRSGADSPIYRVSDAAIAGDPDRFMDEMGRSGGVVVFHELAGAQEFERDLGPLLKEGLRPMLSAGTPQEALGLMRRFQVLCAVRRGPFGVEGINTLAERVLRGAGLVGHRQSPQNPWFHGRPVLATLNDPELGLFNGDLGLAWTEGPGLPLKTWFQGSKDGIPRSLAPVRLPMVQTAFALTVHKSQGSEFQEVVVVIPDRISPVLTRELIYTGITRAREKVHVWASQEVLTTALRRRVERMSGLAEAMAQPEAPLSR